MPVNPFAGLQQGVDAVNSLYNQQFTIENDARERAIKQAALNAQELKNRSDLLQFNADAPYIQELAALEPEKARQLLALQRAQTGNLSSATNIREQEFLAEQPYLEELARLGVDKTREGIAATRAGTQASILSSDIAFNQDTRAASKELAVENARKAKMRSVIAQKALAIKDPEERQAYIDRIGNQVGLVIPKTLRDEQGLQSVIDAGDVYGASAPGVKKTAFERKLELLTEGLSPEESRKVRDIMAKTEPPATGSAALTIAQTPGATELVAKSKAQIAAEVEREKTKAQLQEEFKLKPEIAGAVTQRQEAVKQVINRLDEQKDNDSIYGMADFLLTELRDSYEGAIVGPIIGNAPSFALADQNLDAARASVNQTLKQIFKVKGDQFTDADQKFLLAMIPGRTVSRSVAETQITRIQEVLKRKLRYNSKVPIEDMLKEYGVDPEKLKAPVQEAEEPQSSTQAPQDGSGATMYFDFNAKKLKRRE